MEKLPNTNLQDHKIRNTLNGGGGRTDNDYGSKYRSTSGINPFSKHKPVILAKLFCQDFDESRSDYVEDWWTATDKNCGLVPFRVDHYTDVPQNMDGGMNGWEYQRPRGGEASPLRMGDYLSYMDDALPMLHSFSVPSQVSNSNVQNSIMGTCAIQIQNYYSLSFADFPIFKDYYFGVYVKFKNGTRAAYKTCDRTLGDNGADVVISAYGFPEGDWEAYPFISTEYLDGITEKIANYYTVPMVQKIEFQVVSTLMIINITARYNYSNGVKRSVSIDSVKVTNRTGSGMTFTNNTIQLRYAGDKLTDDAVYSSSIDTFSVKNDETFTVPLGITQSLVRLPYPERNYYIRVTLNTSQYTANGYIAEEITDLTI